MHGQVRYSQLRKYENRILRWTQFLFLYPNKQNSKTAVKKLLFESWLWINYQLNNYRVLWLCIVLRSKESTVVIITIKWYDSLNKPGYLYK